MLLEEQWDERNPDADLMFVDFPLIIRADNDACKEKPMLQRPREKIRQPREKRKSPRHPMRRAAEVVLSMDEPPVHCVVWDMSDGGARLAIAHPLDSLPRTFTLVLYKDGSVRRNCEVAWTDTRYVGVKFV
jgi:PilZ domain